MSLSKKVGKIFAIIFFVLFSVISANSAIGLPISKASIVIKLQHGTVSKEQFDDKETGLKSDVVLHDLIKEGFVKDDLHINTLSALPVILQGLGYNETQIKRIEAVLQQSLNESAMPLSIALSFTGPTEKPSYRGVRIVSDLLPLDRKKTVFGFRNGDGIAHIKLPTQDVILGNETFTYVHADADRQENGMFSLYPQRSDPISYLFKGVFYAQGHTFVIDDVIHVDEEKIYYER